MPELHVLKNPNEIKALYEKFEEIMKNGGEEINTNLSFQGFSEKEIAFWRPDLNIWCCFDPEWGGNSYYGCIFGNEKPTKNHPNMIVQINCNKNYSKKQTTGRFLKDNRGNYWVGHSGKFGGNFKGTEQQKFFDFCKKGNPQPVKWFDGTPENIIVIGRVNEELPQKIANYITEVSNFKDWFRINSNTKEISLEDHELHDFIPEGTSQKKVIQQFKTYTVYRNHGKVVNELHENFRSQGFKGYKDVNIDLYVLSNKCGILFEIKTDTTTTSIYTAIGQLLFYSARLGTAPRKIIVLPSPIDQEREKILSSLGIEVLLYIYKENKLQFLELEKLVQNME
jgi:hypothetical protein